MLSDWRSVGRDGLCREGIRWDRTVGRGSMVLGGKHFVSARLAGHVFTYPEDPPGPVLSTRTLAATRCDFTQTIPLC